MAKRSAEGRASPAEDSDLMKITPLGSGQEVGAVLGLVWTSGLGPGGPYSCPYSGSSVYTWFWSGHLVTPGASGREELPHRPVQGQEDHAGLWHPPWPHWHGRPALRGHDRGRSGQGGVWSWVDENWVVWRIELFMRTGVI